MTGPAPRAAGGDVRARSAAGPASLRGVGAIGIAGYFLLPPAAQNLALHAPNLLACAVILLVGGTGGLRRAPAARCWRASRRGRRRQRRVLRQRQQPTRLGVPVGRGRRLPRRLTPARRRAAATAARPQRDLPAVLDTRIITVGFATARTLCSSPRCCTTVDEPARAADRAGLPRRGVSCCRRRAVPAHAATGRAHLRLAGRHRPGDARRRHAVRRVQPAQD